MQLIMLVAFDKFTLQGDEEVLMVLNGSNIKNQTICVGEDGYIKYLDNDLLVKKIYLEDSELRKENKRLQRLLNEALEKMIIEGQ